MASSGIAIRSARITDRSFVGEYDRCRALDRTQSVQNCIPTLERAAREAPDRTPLVPIQRGGMRSIKL
ncbi:hypothetical protein V476_04930 [Pseudomonas syringae KCTC 12500]|uniref:Uncharacterized protein n=1 Tax=Pseudomonas syringae pv. japonica str. M301072 TaxID=629262 RepID=F3FIA5_PSESX|nr:hypothetical protein PSYJA_13592 [Pseudomonas syringae pv. japonica str. M301072]ELQ05498.1 hypothetical protein A987_06452 [Pseudomonas syringae BRIP34881]KMY00521.1 hypothetical protein V476_04930 [Pseudomonas syringae KCTC 12500]POR86450.1 hypothetical protein BKM21_05170 [Pseudomonas syringae pv. syringae]